MANLLKRHIVGGGLDSDCVAFNSAVGTLDATEEAAICALVSQLKTDGIWAKCFAIFPFAGTTAAEQKWQLKDPRDLDAAYRLTFSDHSHSITGTQMNLSTVVIDTHLNTSILDPNDVGLTVAIRSNTTNNKGAFGGFTNNFIILDRTNLVGSRMGSGTFFGSAPYNSVAEGVATGTINGTSVVSYKDGGIEGSGTVPSPSITSSNVFFGRADLIEFCFGAIHEGLTGTEVANFHTAIDTYSATYTGRKNW